MYINEKIGVEIECDGNADAAFRLAKELVEKWHRESNPSLYLEQVEQVPDVPVIPKTNEQKKEKQISSHIETIKGCSTLKAVEIFRKLVERENNPKLTETFENKLKQLQ